MIRVLTVLLLVAAMVAPGAALAQSPDQSPAPSASPALAITPYAQFLAEALASMRDIASAQAAHNLQARASDLAAAYIGRLLTVYPAPCYQGLYAANWKLASLLDALGSAPVEDQQVVADLVLGAVADVGSMSLDSYC